MANRERQNELKIYLSDDEQYILDQKWKASGMKSKSAFIRHLILYGYVYDVNYEHLREYNTTLARIGNNLNQIANRLKCRYRSAEKKTELCHTLNGSALALPRIVAALLENNQTPEGIRIPKALVPYCGFDMID